MAAYIYILTNKKNGTLYIGMTTDIAKRIYEHKMKFVPGFTRKYGLNRRIYYHEFGSINEAVDQEKRLKSWRRQWKLDLIEKSNPNWEDLYNQL